MKIKASQIKPGMVIGIDRGGAVNSKKKYWDACLITTVNGVKTVEYTHLDLYCNMGRMVGTIDGDRKVKVFTGKKRKTFFDVIKSQILSNLRRAEAEVELVRLVEAMDEGV